MPGANNIVIQRYLDRLHHSARRSGLLYAFPTRSVKRLDLTRLRVADTSLPNEAITKLIRSEGGKLQFDLDISQQEFDDEAVGQRGHPAVSVPLTKGRQKSAQQLLYYALTSGLARTAEAFKRETGVRSLWLAYPLFYSRIEDDTGKFANILSPVFLWPIKIEAPLQFQGRVVISRDEDAGGPKYNKALDIWITEHLNFNPDDPKRDEFDEISRTQMEEVVRQLYQGLRPAPAVSLLGDPLPIPDRLSLENMSSPRVLNSGVLGLIQWENQALTHDFENLLKYGRTTELLNDFLSGKGRETNREIVIPPEHDRFHVTDADPSQERAVWLARDGPGLVVHGPPGTGKSQTIVNMVADTLAHEQRVLVICQKRAAIDVVAARLKAHGLGDLFCVVHDSESDRTQTILGIRKQITDFSSWKPTMTVAIRRSQLAKEIVRLESQLSEYSEAVCGLAGFGLPYRDLLAKAAKLCAGSGRVQPNERLKSLFVGRTLNDLAEIEGEIKATGELWERARPKTNPWRFRNSDVSIDPISKDALQQDLAAINSQDEAHTKFVAEWGEGFTIASDPFDFPEREARWLEQIKAATGPNLFEACCLWLSRLTKDGPGPLDSVVAEIQPLLGRFTSISRHRYDETYAKEFCAMYVSLAKRRLEVTAALVELETKWWRWFSPAFHRLHRELKNSLGRVARTSAEELQRLREFWLVWLARQHWALCFSLALAAEAESEPCFKQVISHFAQSNSVDLATDLQELSITIERAPFVAAVVKELERLNRWFQAGFVAALRERVCAGESIKQRMLEIKEGFTGLDSLQMLDLNRPYREDLARDVLGSLETDEPEAAPKPGTPERWWNVVQLSAFISWKEACEVERPVLRRMNVAQFEESQRRLATALEQKRELEVAFVRELWHERQASRRKGDFNGILVTRGPNSKRLRQVVELGQAVGLFDFRPCWLTNPNTASQIFPLAEQFFDLVIFDEASQCPIEQAIPAIFRAKRLVVAGDEKQLPPTAFFQSGFSFGDEPADESELETSAQLDVDEQLAAARQQQALAVTDLLEASKPLLRECLLNIHYRSEHPALISFSNHAFYSGRLQMPPSVHRKVANAPLVLIEANGVYEKNQNVAEAQQVVSLLRSIWLASEQPPTVGVVTFNEVQRDLIEDMLMDEAAKDVEFQSRYVAERNRVEHEQDVGFFVRNLESVQGDERDVMIFSTTFGRDPQGQFRRFFGPINQLGGERRLNVAITRAKKRNYVITSMPLHEISDALAGGGAPVGISVGGRDYLHAYMQYVKAVSTQDLDAQQQTLTLVGRLATLAGTMPSAGKEDSLFEAEVRDALTALGYTSVSQVGESGFRIDLAVVHPNPERGYVLGIECDGKSYHSEWTARARDIWRQRILEQRGWKIHRIWSTNWWLDRDFELRKLVARIRSLSRA